MSVLIDDKLKLNKGTQRTLVRVSEEERTTVPMWVTWADSLLGNWTKDYVVAVIEVNRSTEQAKWSVAPISNTQVHLS